MKAIKRFELVELVIPAGSTGNRFPYPDIPQLRDDTTQDIIIRSLRSYTVETMPLSAQGNAVSTTAQLLNCFLVLYINGEESMRLIPLIQLNTLAQSASNGTTIYQQDETEVENLQVDWNKSYIQMATPPGTVGAPNAQFSIMLGVSYKKLPAGTWASITKNAIPGF